MSQSRGSGLQPPRGQALVALHVLPRRFPSQKGPLAALSQTDSNTELSEAKVQVLKNEAKVVEGL